MKQVNLFKILKNIVFFIPTLGQGGAEKVFLNLANEFVKRHEVHLILQDIDGVLMKDLNSEILIHNFGKSNFNLFFRLLKFIVIYKPDAIISTLNIPNILNALAHRLSFGSYKLITRQASPVKIKQHQKIMSNALRRSFKQSNTVIANSLSTKLSIQNVLKLTEADNLKVIYNPIFDKKFYDLAIERSGFLEKFLNNGEFMLAMGRLEDSKNFNLLIKAFSLSKVKEYSNLIILGEGSQRIKLEKLVDDLGLKNKIFLPGNISNPYPFYSSAKLFISSSRWEGFGNVIVEALSFGLPVIITNGSGAPSEIIENGKYGFLADNNAQALGNKIDEVYHLKDIDEENLRNRAKEFSVKEISKQYEEIFN